jgi:hypothetical protein
MAINLSELKGVKDHPPRALLIGGRGVGKTMTATGAEAPMFLDLEKSKINRRLGAGHQRPQTYEDVLDYIDALMTQEHTYISLIIDTLDKLEIMLTDYICRKNGYANINQTSWGEGLSKRTQEWTRLLSLLDELNSRGMFIILVAHTVVEEVRDPMLPAYDRHTTKLYKRDGPLIGDWVDLIGFCQIKTWASGAEGERKIANTAGERVICCQPNPCYDAKTRYLGMPNEIPMDWGTLLHYMINGSKVQDAEQNTTTGDEN